MAGASSGLSPVKIMLAPKPTSASNPSAAASARYVRRRWDGRTMRSGARGLGHHDGVGRRGGHRKHLLVESRDQGRAVGRSRMAVERERRRGEGSEEGRRVRTDRLDGGSLLPGLREHLRDGVRGLERRPPGEQLEEDDPERVHVALRPDLSAARLLGRHVLGRPDDGARRGQRRVREGPSDAEVRDLGVALAVEEDVRRLQVAVDDPVLVGVARPAARSRRDSCRLIVGKRLRLAADNRSSSVPPGTCSSTRYGRPSKSP